MRILALDVGRNKTGVAISEETLGIVTPLKPVLFRLHTSPQGWFEALVKMLGGYDYSPDEVGLVVVGSWRDDRHPNSEMKRLVKLALEAINRNTSWRVVMVRETNTTVESREILRGMGVKGKRMYRSLDCYAASLLLIDYLELVRPNMEREESR